MASPLRERSMKPHVLILGAGLGGLTLAQSLRKQGITFEIFERDEYIHSRSGGWAIAVHTILHRLEQSFESDVPRLEEANHLRPLDLPAQLCFYGGPQKAFVQSSVQQPIVRANRQRLRELLSTGIDVRWGAHVSEIKQGSQGVSLSFADGSIATGDVLVGADGAGSVVRRYLLPEAQLSTLPAGVINGELTLTQEQFKRQLQLAHSAYVAGAPGFHLYVGLSGVLPNGNGAKYYWFLNFYAPEACNEPFWTATATKQEMLDFALEKSEQLHPRLAEIVQLTHADDIRAPPIVFRDLLLHDIPDGRITLLGDAVHPMAPFRGEGGSHALEDALNLAEAIAGSTVESIPVSLKAYEDEMLPRGRGGVERSRAVLEPGKGADMTFAWGQPFKFAALPSDLS